MESYGFPSTSLTPTTNPNNSTSSFKSPSNTNLSSGKNSKGTNPATEYPEEISFLLQRPGEQKRHYINAIWKQIVIFIFMFTLDYFEFENQCYAI